MDLNEINLSEKAENGAVLELEHPVTGEVLRQDDGEPITITLLGTDSKVYRKKQKQQQEKRLNKVARSRSRKAIGNMLDDEDVCDLLASCTVGWNGVVMGGAELEFSYQAAYQLYKDYPWIREQVDEFIGDRANFFTGK